MEELTYRVTVLNDASQFMIRFMGLPTSDYFTTDGNIYQIHEISPVKKTGLNWNTKQDYNIIAEKLDVNVVSKV